jgi:hypothetical protein
MMVSGLRVLLSALRMLFGVGMIALAVQFSGGTVCLRGILVVIGSFVVFVSCHSEPHSLYSLPAGASSRAVGTFPLTVIAA